MKFDHNIFLTECGHLNPSQQDGIITLLTFMENDENMTDLRWDAYGLATVDRECGGEWKPIEEYSKGLHQPYGVVDPLTGFAYYGRGYVQTTWASNYKAMSKAWSVNNPDEQVNFYTHPELMLVPKYSYFCMSYGMRRGAYTGVGLSKYIHDDVCDYVNARRIINGTDNAQHIADAAKWFEDVLRKSLIK